MLCLQRMMVAGFTLLCVLVLSGIPLFAQPGYTPDEAVTITAASMGEVRNSRRLPDPVASNWPEACGAYAAPYYDEFWFKYAAAKDEKVMYLSALTLQGYEDDFAAILFVYEQTETGLSQIGCHAYGADWILSIRPNRTYLFRVAALSSAPGEDPMYLGHGGTIQLYILSSPIGVFRYRGEAELLGWVWNDQSLDLIVMASTSPNFFCDESDATTTPRKWNETLIRNGTDHLRSMGDLYTNVYRPSDFGEAVDLINTNYCEFVGMTDSLVAEGIAKYSNNDNNLVDAGNKSDTWRESLIGRLTDIKGKCPSGATGLQWHYTEYCPKEGCSSKFVLRNEFGPKLTCDSPK